MATLVDTLLDAVTTTGAGTPIDLESTGYRLHTVIVTAAGTNPVATVQIQVSHDPNSGAWATVGTLSFTGPATKTLTFEAPIRYIRAEVTQLTGPQDGVVSGTVSSG